MFKKIKQQLEKIHKWLIYEEEFLDVEEYKLIDTIKEYKHKISGYHFKKLFIPHKINNHRPYMTHHHVLASFVLAIFTFKIFIVGSLVPTNNAYAGGISSQDLIKMTNDIRREMHIPELQFSEKLTLSARLKAEDMFEKQYWSHNSPDGVKPWQFFDEVGYFYEHAGENLATNFHSSDGVMEGWKNSRTHYENLIDPKYEEVGIAVVPGIFDGKNTTIVVQHFGKKLKSKSEIKTQPIQKRPEVIDEKKFLNAPEIQDPQDKSVVNKSKLLIKGLGDNNVLVHVLDDDMNLGLVPTDDYGRWSYISPKLYDGTHILEAYLEDNGTESLKSKPIQIDIDTVAPEVILDSVNVLHSVENGKDKFNIEVAIDDNPSIAEILAGYQKQTLTLQEDNIYTGEISFDKQLSVTSYPIMIHAKDDAGNSTTVDFILEPVEDSSAVLGDSSEENNKATIENEELILKNEIQAEDTTSKENKLFDSKKVMNNVMEPKVEKELSAKVTARIHYIKIATLIIGTLFVLMFLLQAYVVYNKGIQSERTHPIFHAVSILCIMILIIII